MFPQYHSSNVTLSIEVDSSLDVFKTLSSALSHRDNRLMVVKMERAKADGDIAHIVAHKFTNILQHMSIIEVDVRSSSGYTPSMSRSRSRSRARITSGKKDTLELHVSSRSVSIFPTWVPFAFVLDALLFWLPFSDNGVNSKFVSQLLVEQTKTKINSSGSSPSILDMCDKWSIKDQHRYNELEDLSAQEHQSSAAPFFFTFIVGPVLLGLLFVICMSSS